MMRRITKLGALAAITLAFGVTACDNEADAFDVDAPVLPSLNMTLDVSSFDAPVGSNITVGIRGGMANLGALQGQLDYRSARLRYVGQEAGQSIALVNANDPGAVRVVAFDVDGLPEYSAKLVFEVLAADYTRSMRFAPEVAVAVDEQVLDAPRSISAREVLSLSAQDVSVLNAMDWVNRLYPEHAVEDMVFMSPGQGCNGETDTQGQGYDRACGATFDLRFGDITMDQNVNILDALAAARIGAGLDSLITAGSEPGYQEVVFAGNIRPANLPGLGEAGDDLPPGWVSFPDNPGVIDVLDAFAMALEGARLPGDPTVDVTSNPNNRPAGDPNVIPGRELPGTQCTDVWAAGTLTGVHHMPVTPGCIQVLEGILWIGDQSTNTPGKLEIEAGTMIESQEPGAILVTRVGEIEALGTAMEPIVMTCQGEANGGVPEPGCWGGLGITGNAGVVEQEAGIPTSPDNLLYTDGSVRVPAGSGGCNTRQLEGNGPLFGGCVQDDSSGVLQYTVIMYGGRAVLPNNELNVLTLGGVGSGTVIDHVQMVHGFDDCFEAFGGSVNAKYLSMYQCNDDHLDVSFGYHGTLQYVIVDQTGGDKAIEADNTETPATYDAGLPPEESPFPGNVVTTPDIWQCTIIGDGLSEAGRTRRGTAYQLYDCFVGGHDELIDIDDDETCTDNSTANDGSGMVLWQDVLVADYASAGSMSGAPNCATLDLGTASASDLLFTVWGNTDAGASTLITQLMHDPTSPVYPDYRPLFGTDLNNARGRYPSEVYAPGHPALSFLDEVNYIGAAAPSGITENQIGWWMGWTYPFRWIH